MFNKKIFEKVEYRKLIDKEFPIPVGYNEYLTKIYGDYMGISKSRDRIYHGFEEYAKK